MISVVISFAGCCTGVKELISSPSGRTMIPPGCCPVVRRIPVHPCTIRSISQFRLRAHHALRNNFSHNRTLSYPPAVPMVPARKVCPAPKDYFCIFMCLTLILTGEVQVDIRLFVSLESQESLKRNIKPHLSSMVFHTAGISYPACHNRHGRNMLSLRRNQNPQ